MSLTPPPLVPGAFLLGNALPMLRGMPAFLLEQYRTFGPIFRVRALHHRFTVLAGPEANLFMTRGGAKRLTSGVSFGRMAQELRSPNLLVALDGPRHTAMRRMLRPAYSREAAERGLPTLAAVVERIVREQPIGQTIPVRMLMQRLVTEQVGMAAVGHGGGPEVCKHGADFSRTLTGASLGRWPAFYLWSPRYRRAKAWMEALAHTLIARRRSESEGPREPADLADIFIHGKDVEGKPFVDGDLIYGVLGAFVAGMDTAASVASFLTWEILRQPALLEGVIAEVDTAFASGPPTAQGLRQMRLLRGAYFETLRLHPINVALPRHAAEPFEFGGHQIAAGERLLIGATVSHFLPEYFPEPHTFDAERYGAPRNEDKQPGAFAPFGLGHHVCLGTGQAEIVVMLAVATLLRSLRVELSPPDYQIRGELTPLPTVELACGLRVLERRSRPSVATPAVARRLSQMTQILPTLNRQLLVDVSARLVPRAHPAGTNIIRQGDASDRFYILVDGEVEVLVEDGASSKRVNVLGDDSFFGEIGLLTGSRRTATVRAISDVFTLELDGEDFRTMVDACDLTSQELARVMRERVVASAIDSPMPSVDAALAARVAPRLERRAFAQGDVVFRQGDPASHFFVLVTGACDETCVGPTGQEIPVDEHLSGDFFGEADLLAGAPRTATVRAREAVMALALTREDFRALSDEGKLATEAIARLMRRHVDAGRG